jgi:hypothetical protein
MNNAKKDCPTLVKKTTVGLFLFYTVGKTTDTNANAGFCRGCVKFR